MICQGFSLTSFDTSLSLLPEDEVTITELNTYENISQAQLNINNYKILNV